MIEIDPAGTAPGPEPGPESEGLTARQRIKAGRRAWEQDRYVDALRSFRAVLDEHPGFADIRNLAGHCLAMLGEFELALEEFDLALEENDRYLEAHLNRAITLNELGRFDEAREAFETASELDRNQSDPYPGALTNEIVEAHARIGELYLEAADPDRAVEQFEWAVRLRPKFLDIRLRLAQGYLEQGKLAAAEGELEEILDVNPFFLEARIKLGLVRHRRGDDAAAAAAWRRCVEQSPGDGRAEAYLGMIEEAS